MKLSVVFAACLLVAAVAAQEYGFQRCGKDSDCDGCCYGGIYCLKYAEEGDLCAIRNAIGCGCRPGLECVQTGPLWQQCVDNGGSGGGVEVEN